MRFFKYMSKVNYGLIAVFMFVSIFPQEAFSKWGLSKKGDNGDLDSQINVNFDFEAGINELPPELLDRWYAVTSQADIAKFSDYIEEGRLIISQLGSLINALGSTVPGSDHPSYGVYTSLKNRLLSTIDRITLKIVYDIPDSEIQALLEEYNAERIQTSQENKIHRRELLRNGMELLRRHQRERFFLRYPHRKAALAGLYFRITELMYQEAYEVYLESTDTYIEELNRLAETDPAAMRNLKAPIPDYSRVKAMYQRIVDEFPTSEYADDALYNIGFLTSESSSSVQKANANRIFETLISIYPESEYTLNALRRIAEYYFMPPANNLEKAAKTYHRIANEFPDSPYYQEALYKLGWTYYRLSDLPTSVKHFAMALDVNYSDRSLDNDNSTVLDISSESINYIGICYAVESTEWAGSGVDNMAIWLDEHPLRKQNYGRDLIIQLGEIFRNQIGRYGPAVEVYRKYMEIFPLDPRTPEIMHNIVDIFQQGEIYNPPQAHIEKKAYFNMLNPDSEWWAANTDSSLRESIIPTLEKYLDMAIDEVLILASDQGLEESYLEFDKYCRQYLRFWPNGPNAYKIQANLATVLERNLNRPMDAMREYYQVATAYDDTTKLEIASQRVVAIAKNLARRELAGEIYMSPEGDVLPPEMRPQKVVVEVSEIIEEAPIVEEPADRLGEDQIAEGDSLAHLPDIMESAQGDTVEAASEPEVVEAAESSPAESEKSDLPMPTELLNAEKILFSGFDLYLSNFSRSSLAPTVLYQAGDIMYKHQQFADSRPYFIRLITDFPGHQLIGDAYTLILEGFFLNKEYAEVERIAREIDAADVSASLKETANMRKAQSVFLNAKNLKFGEDHIATANEFKRVALESPDFELADQSMFQAGQEYKLGEAWQQANEAFMYIADHYPQSKYADKALYNAGLNAQDKMSDIAMAAKIFEQLVNSYPRSEQAQGALSYASSNYNTLENHEAAIRVNEMYVSLFPDADDANLYLFENAGHYLKLDQMDKANDIYRRFSQRFPDDPRVVRAFFERAVYFLADGNRNQAEREFRQTVDAHKRLVAKEIRGNPKYASQALSQLLRWEHDNYDNLKFRLPVANITAAVARKKQWRNSLYEKYQQILELGQKEGYKAFYQMGMLDEELAISTIGQEIPRISDQNQKAVLIEKIVNESLILNDVATETFIAGISNLKLIYDQLSSQQQKMASDYARFDETITRMQLNDAEGLADSLDKQRNMNRALAQIDSAVIESEMWGIACRRKIPEISARNGDYLLKIWNGNLKVRGNDSEEEINLLIREEVLNSSVAPIAPEICGFYLQAIMVAAEFNEVDKYLSGLEASFVAVVDTLFNQYQEQCDIAQARIDRFTDQYIEMLPHGEDAESPDGFYPDEMGIIIQDQVDYLNNFNMDFLLAFEVILDTASVYTLPPSFAEDIFEEGFRFVLDKHELLAGYADQSTIFQNEYTAKYDETDELQYDDAAIAFEDLAAFVTDYDQALLEEGLRLRQSFSVPTMSGIELVKVLINLRPDQYASQFTIEAEKTTVISSSDWKIWPQYEGGFESADFFDFDWDYVMFPDNSYNVDLGMLDILNARPVWYNMDKPTKPGADMNEIGEGTALDSLAFDFEEGVDEGDTVTTEIAKEDSLITDPEDGGEVDEPSLGDEVVVEEPSDTTGGSPGEEADQLLEMISGEIENQYLADENTELEAAFAIEDSIYQFWMGVDSDGIRQYWMRSTFDIDSEPSAGTVWLTADDDYSLFLNGVYIAADDRDTLDYFQVDEYDIFDYLQLGSNLIALEISDVDNSRRGVIFGLIYESIPDMDSQLDIIVANEIEQQIQLLAEREIAWIAIAGASADEASLLEKRISAERTLRMRTIEKNKLR